MMNWPTLLSAERLGKSHSAIGEYGRSQFHKDYDRIVFSAAFRRLQRKTQVHPLPDNDNIHTRLTHSLEVSCVARSLGLIIGQKLTEADKLPAEVSASEIGAIVQAASLAHDIGNPPFGHAGEFAVRDWFSACDPALLNGLTDAEQNDLKTYEGNANGFRLLAARNNGVFDGGMRLTYATLATFIKYPWTVDAAPENKRHKFGAFQADLPLMERVAAETGLLRISDRHWCRHPLVYVVEAADDLCYGLIDIEDGVELGLIAFDEWERELTPLHPGPLPAEYHAEKKLRRKMSYLRGKVMTGLLHDLGAAFIANEEALLSGTFDGDLLARCRGGDVIEIFKNLAEKQLYLNHQKMQVEVGAFQSIGILLDCFCRAAYDVSTTPDGQRLSYKTDRVRQLVTGEVLTHDRGLYANYMSVLDFIAGMTDDYAAALARQLSGNG